jgi:DNA-binding beta-propeller fold protein YncE
MGHRIVPILACAVCMAACSTSTSATNTTRAKSQPAPTLLLTTRTGVEAVSTTGAVRYRIAGGVTTADGATVMATAGDRLLVWDARTGLISATVPVGPGLVVSTVSPDGHDVALTTTPSSTYLPAGRSRTQITVVKLPGKTLTRYDLTGNFAPDAFSSDGRDLFLVSYLPAEAPNRYQITSLDLVSSTVDGVFGREKEALEDMQGVAGMKAFAPDHKALYTLYLRPPTQPGAGPDNMRAEVHTLKLDARWAHCVDLPEGIGGSNLSASAIAVSPDGSHLYVVDRAARRLVEVDTDALTVTRSVDVPFSAPSSSAAIVMSRDGRLYIGDGPSILAIRTDTLAVSARLPTAGPVSALAVAGDGHGLFASSPHHIDAFDVAHGPQTSTPLPDDAVAISHILT